MPNGACWALAKQIGAKALHRIEPTPIRGRHIPWSVFLKAHWRAIAASDFFSVEVWSLQGLVPHYVLFVIELATRRVVICGITTNPNEAWMLQAARNGAPMLRRALREYMEHYHRERNHQCLDNQLIALAPKRQPHSKRIESRVRLGGMLRFYERAAA